MISSKTVQSARKLLVGDESANSSGIQNGAYSHPVQIGKLAHYSWWWLFGCVIQVLLIVFGLFFSIDLKGHTSISVFMRGWDVDISRRFFRGNTNPSETAALLRQIEDFCGNSKCRNSEAHGERNHLQFQHVDNSSGRNRKIKNPK